MFWPIYTWSTQKNQNYSPIYATGFKFLYLTFNFLPRDREKEQNLRTKSEP